MVIGVNLGGKLDFSGFLEEKELKWNVLSRNIVEERAFSILEEHRKT